MILKENFCKVKTCVSCFSGYYETLLSTLVDDMTEENYLWDNTNAVNDNIKQFIYDNEYKVSNYKLAFEDISKEIVNFYNDLFKSEKLQIKFKFEKLYSPKFYNYDTDEIQIKALFTTDFIHNNLEKCIHDNIKTFKEYIKNEFEVRPGFRPYYSDDYKEWLSYINKEMLESNGTIFNVLMEFYIRTEINKDIENDIYEYCHNVFYSNGKIFDNKYFNTSEMCNLINEEYNLNINSLEELEGIII